MALLLLFKLISELLTFHELLWWIAGVIQVATSSLYALYIDLNFFRTYGWLISRNMTYAEHKAMESVESIADFHNIECDNYLSIYDRQRTYSNIKEMLGSICHWILPIPQTIRLQLPYLQHMKVNSKALENTKKLLNRLKQS